MTPEPAPLSCLSPCLSPCLSTCPSDPRQTPPPGHLSSPRPAFPPRHSLLECFQSTPSTHQWHKPYPFQIHPVSPPPRWFLPWWPSFCPTTCSPRWEPPSLSRPPTPDTSSTLTSHTPLKSSPPLFPTRCQSQSPAPRPTAAPPSPTASPPSSSPDAPRLSTCCSWRKQRATGWRSPRRWQHHSKPRPLFRGQRPVRA